jgi:hypothetical protein
MLSPEKHCEMLSADARHRSAAMIDGFKLFIQLYLAIVGGSLILRLQYEAQVPASVVGASNAMVALLAIASLALVIDSFRSWYGHRARLSEVAGRDQSGKLVIPEPNLRKSSGSFIVMVVLIVAASILFWMFNPLRIS